MCNFGTALRHDNAKIMSNCGITKRFSIRSFKFLIHVLPFQRRLIHVNLLVKMVASVSEMNLPSSVLAQKD